jgi:hypothetical protein
MKFNQNFKENFLPTIIVILWFVGITLFAIYASK